MKGKTAAETYAETLERKVYLTDKEGSVYTNLSLPTFRAWSKMIGASRKVGNRNLHIKEIIDKNIWEGKL